MLLTMAGVFPSEPLMLRIFANDWRPSKRDTAATYREATGGGYVPIAIPAEEWRVSDLRLHTINPQKFVFSGPCGPFYGYYVTQALTGGLLWAERFPGLPPIPKHAGDLIVVTPTWRLTEAVL